MRTLARIKTIYRSNRDAGIEVSPIKSLIDMRATLSAKQQEITAACETAEKSLEADREMVKAWNSRVIIASDMLKQAKTDAAVRDINMLISSARKYSEAHQARVDKNKDVHAKLLKTSTEMNNVLADLMRSEQAYELESGLRQLNAGGLESDALTGPGVDTREIARLLHTAQALIELTGQPQDAITA